MKRIFSILILSLFATVSVFACEISTTIIKEKKSYNIGDEIVIKVKIVLFHRNCNVDIKTTQYKSEGLKILAGTDWVETSTGTWERKLKVKITEDKADKASLKIYRTCNKTGGSTTVTFNL